MTVGSCCQLLTSVNLANLLQISNLKMRIQITVTFINITILLYYTILYYTIISSILFRYIYCVKPCLNKLHHFTFYRLSLCHLIKLIRSFSMVRLVVLTLDMRNKPIWHHVISTILVVPPRLMYFHIFVLKFHILNSKQSRIIFSRSS